MTTAKGVPIIDGLFAERPEGAKFLGSRCASCGARYFPKVTFCHNPACDEPKIEDYEFGRKGKIYAFTILHFPPPPPAWSDSPFTPYAIAQVDLDEGLRVLGRVATDDFKKLAVGKEVELIIDPLYRDAEGTDRLTWKFRLV